MGVCLPPRAFLGFYGIVVVDVCLASGLRWIAGSIHGGIQFVTELRFT